MERTSHNNQNLRKHKADRHMHKGHIRTYFLHMLQKFPCIRCSNPTFKAGGTLIIKSGTHVSAKNSIKGHLDKLFLEMVLVGEEMRQ